MTPRSRWEYFKAIYERYRQAEPRLKRVILKEFCLTAEATSGITRTTRSSSLASGVGGR